MVPEIDLMQLAGNGTDEEWQEATGACGGCGDDTCHDGPCRGEICRICPTRVREGWFCGPGCRSEH